MARRKEELREMQRVAIAALLLVKSFLNLDFKVNFYY
jgi:hypothetical protein